MLEHKKFIFLKKIILSYIILGASRAKVKARRLGSNKKESWIRIMCSTIKKTFNKLKIKMLDAVIERLIYIDSVYLYRLLKLMPFLSFQKALELLTIRLWKFF